MQPADDDAVGLEHRPPYRRYNKGWHHKRDQEDRAHHCPTGEIVLSRQGSGNSQGDRRCRGEHRERKADPERLHQRRVGHGLDVIAEAGKGRAEPLTEGVLIKSEERYVQAKQDRHHDNEDHQNTARDQHPEWAVARGSSSSVPDVRRRSSATCGGLASQSAWSGLAGRICLGCRHVKPYGALSSEVCAVFCAAVSSDCNFESLTDPLERSGIVCTTTFIRAS